MGTTEHIMEYLRQVRMLQVLSDKALAKYKEAESRLYAVSIPLSNDTRVQKSGDPHSMEKRLANVEALKDKALEQLDRLIHARNDVLNTIEQMSYADGITVLSERYAFCRTWAAIAESAGMTERYCYRVHNKALQELREITAGQELNLY